MKAKPKFIEVNYHCHQEFNRPEQVIEKHKAASGFAGFLLKDMNVVLVKHLNYEGEDKVNGVRYRFFKSKNKFWFIPFRTHRFIKNEKPDIVLVQGFVFVLQVLILRFQLGRNCKIMLQHHGEKPFKGIKGLLQRFTSRFIDGYIFTSFGNANEWIQARVIRDKSKCYELLAASTWFERQDKETSKLDIEMDGSLNFLWVGRLNQNKDPLTVLAGFEKYLSVNPDANLHMIYQEDDMLPVVKDKVFHSKSLQMNVFLQGSIQHELLEEWYSAADFFISGSHREGGSYALLEAMACGCIPIVTSIPSALKVIADGKYGLLFKPGDVDGLFNALASAKNISIAEFSEAVENHFHDELSFSAIARQLNVICQSLVAK